jgi:hypothetical protein
MAGLVPAIHVFRSDSHRKNVDARHKAGHDGASGDEGSNSHSERGRLYFVQPTIACYAFIAVTSAA